MRIVVTGSEGFIGKNLRQRLLELGHTEIVSVGRSTTREQLDSAVAGAEFVFHLAGVNRSRSNSAFVVGNAGFTEDLCLALASAGGVPIAYASSTHALLDTPYGRSKLAAEETLQRYSRNTGAQVSIFRLTNVFGKWSKPNYNSAIATFCYQVANGLPLSINDPAAKLRLIYIDDVVDCFVRLLATPGAEGGQLAAGPVYETTVGDVARVLQQFADSRGSLIVPNVGTGLLRALYSTYLTFLPPESFAYKVPCHEDRRGIFVEMLRTVDSGQISYFTAHPGVTRGEHYHHTKTEKFLVIQGTAEYRFREVQDGRRHVVVARGGDGQIVESIPGWAHDVTNVGHEQLIVMLWANEIFDRARPDTFAMKIGE